MSAEAIEEIAEASRWAADTVAQLGEHNRKLVQRLEDCHKGLKACLAKNMTGFVVGWDRVKDGERRYIAAATDLKKMTHTGTVETAQVWVTRKGIAEWLEDIHRSWGEDNAGKPWPAPVTLLAGVGCERLIIYQVQVQVQQFAEIPIKDI